MNSPLPPPPASHLGSPLSDSAPTRRRPGGGEPSNAELLVAIGDGHDDDEDASKTRRKLHLKLGPFVLSGAALEQVQARAATFRSASISRLTLETLRPLPLFLGVSGPSFCLAADAFSPPLSLSRKVDKSSLEKVMSRLSRNWNFFATNYALLAACTLLVVALMHPGMLVYVGLTWALWLGHAVLVREDGVILVRNKDLNHVLTPKRREWVLTAWTAWVALAKCLRPSLKWMAVSGALVMLHATMRDPANLAGDIVAARSGVLSRASSDGSNDSSAVLVEREDAV